MKILPVLGVCLLIAQISEGAVIGEYTCLDPDKNVFGDETIQFTLLDEQGHFSRIFLDNGHRGRDCKAVGRSNLTLELGTDEQQINSLMCKVRINENGIVETRIIATRNENEVQLSDLVFPVSCDFSKSSTQEIRTSHAVQQVSGLLDLGIAEDAREDIKLEVTDAFGNVLDACYIGQDIRLRLKLKKSDTARQVRALTCWSGDTSNDRYEFLKESCARVDAPLQVDLDEKGAFNYEVTGLDRSDTYYTKTIKKFRVFGFNTESSILTYGCTVDFCRDESDPRCSKDTCGQTRYKRQDNSGVQAGASIEVLSQREIDNRAKIAAFTKNRNGKTCNGTQDVWFIGMWLGILCALFALFVALTFVICCCCVVGRGRHNTSHASERSYPSRTERTERTERHDNPSHHRERYPPSHEPPRDPYYGRPSRYDRY